MKTATISSAAVPSLSAEAYTIVRERILSGQLRLGETVSRRKLARELGMSFLPASEAMIRLEFEGLLESRPRAGTRVRVPSVDDVRGHFVVREALEVQAARLCAREATASEKAALLRLAIRVDTLAQRGASATYVTVHQQLHRRIADLTRCQSLCQALEHLHALNSMWICAGGASAEEDGGRRHQDLVVAIMSGDCRRAEETVRAHVRFGLDHALAALHPYFTTRRLTSVFSRT